jgi:predicted porin
MERGRMEMSTTSKLVLLLAALVFTGSAVVPARVSADERNDLILQLLDQNRALTDQLADQERRLGALENRRVSAGAPVGAAAIPGKHTVYGDLRLSLSRTETDSGSGSMETTSQDSNNSRIGMKGWYGNDEWKAIYHIELGLNQETDRLDDHFDNVVTRRRYGTVKYGTMSTPYKMPGYLMDPFYDTAAGPGFAGANFGLSPQTNNWVSNALTYTSPSFSGFTVNAGAFFDDADGDDHSMTGGVEYKDGPFKGGIQLLDATNETDLVTASDRRLARLYSNYTFDERLTLAGSWEKAWIDEAADINYYYGVARFALTPRVELASSVGYVDAGAGEGIGLTFGVFYKVLQKTTLYGLISNINRHAESTATPNRLVFSTGVSHKFAFGN